jgi:F420-dependent methylenetetrahydromethanopterin dehydrogenase
VLYIAISVRSEKKEAIEALEQEGFKCIILLADSSIGAKRYSLDSL